MRIYSMTATFGKLSGDTLTLEPGLNVIQAPNEWGKSTWCAFLTAMFYGLDTRSHSTKTALSEKERYTPWSGAPMSGRIELSWNGRDITIERRTKGRMVFGEFRAYETASGLPVPELTAQNCGQVLLGVEKPVFTRSSMIRQTDLPVTQDEALRRRLNALVTTGDDSGTAENLERRLRELKNKCRYNRTGLLPQAEAELAVLDRKLRELNALEAQSRKLRQRRAALEDTVAGLENHRTALRYRAAQENARLRLQAETALQEADRTRQALESQCSGLPDGTTAQHSHAELLELQQRWAQLQLEAERRKPESTHPIFGDRTPEEALEQVRADVAACKKLPLLWLILPLLSLLAGAAVLLYTEYTVAGWCAMGTGFLGVTVWAVAAVLRHRSVKALTDFYGSADPAAWTAAAENYVYQMAQLARSDAQHLAAVDALRQQTAILCEGRSFSEALTYWQAVCAQWDALHSAQKEWKLARERMVLLAVLPVDAPMPKLPDPFTLTEDQTTVALSDAAGELRELQLRLGQCQGQTEAIGHRATLETARNQIAQRIRRLEETCNALDLALNTLEQARNALQRRFAPRITTRAKDILSRLTEGRYDRLVLGEDLTLHTNSRDEETLRAPLWRSDGTADLLYLALRLAVAGELTPEAPLILDDALIRFDDRRLTITMDVLTEEAAQRQIILFTCHSREGQYTKKKEP